MIKVRGWIALIAGIFLVVIVTCIWVFIASHVTSGTAKFADGRSIVYRVRTDHCGRVSRNCQRRVDAMERAPEFRCRDCDDHSIRRSVFCCPAGNQRSRNLTHRLFPSSTRTRSSSCNRYARFQIDRAFSTGFTLFAGRSQPFSVSERLPADNAGVPAFSKRTGRNQRIRGNPFGGSFVVTGDPEAGGLDHWSNAHRILASSYSDDSRRTGSDRGDYGNAGFGLDTIGITASARCLGYLEYVVRGTKITNWGVSD